MPAPILVTGGAGFIGSAVVRALVAGRGEPVVTVDRLTYAGNLDSLRPVLHDPRHVFERVDICDRRALRRAFEAYRPRAVLHLAAESHVDRSIDGPDDFVPGETYAIGGDAERRNLDVVRGICAVLDELAPRPDGLAHETLIRFVEDRPGHDLRYAMDAAKIRRELGWAPRHDFEQGLRETVGWYLDNRWWWERVRSGEYRGERLGLAAQVRA